MDFKLVLLIFAAVIALFAITESETYGSRVARAEKGPLDSGSSEKDSDEYWKGQGLKEPAGRRFGGGGGHGHKGKGKKLKHHSKKHHDDDK